MNPMKPECISKTPYTIEDVRFLKSADELEVDILSTQVEFKFSDEMRDVNPIKTNISFPGLRVQEIESDESVYESQANQSSQEDDELNLKLKSQITSKLKLLHLSIVSWHFISIKFAKN